MVVVVGGGGDKIISADSAINLKFLGMSQCSDTSVRIIVHQGAPKLELCHPFFLPTNFLPKDQLKLNCYPKD